MAKKVLKFYKSYCNRFGGFLKSKPSQELEFAVKFLGWNVKPDHIIGAGMFAIFLGFLAVILLSLVSYFIGLNPTLYIFFSPIAILLFFAITEWPKSLAKQYANKSLAYAPYIISQMAVSIKQTPNLENAISFVSKTNKGKISRDLRDILFNAWIGKVKSVYDETLNLADKWAKFSAGFQRSLRLIISSFHEKDKESKDKTLDNSVDSMLSDITSTMHSYALGLNTPTLVIFSIGTILPLMLISIFPLISFFGFEVSQVTVIAFLGSSLIASYLYSNIVLRKRPVGFPEPKIKKQEKEPTKVIPLIILVLFSIPTAIFIMQSSGLEVGGFPGLLIKITGPYGIVWGIGLAISIHFYMSTSKKNKARKTIKKLENQFIDSLYHIKNSLRDGQPLESALKFSGSMLGKGEIGKYYSAIIDSFNTKRITFEEAVVKQETGSTLIKSSMELIFNAMKKGRVAVMQTTEVIYSYLSRIAKIEAEIKTMLSKTLSMMRATIVIFAPVVCAVIVVLFHMINNTIKNISVSNKDYAFGTIFVQSAISPGYLQIIIGIYLIALNYVLIRYISYLQNGFDKISFHYNLAKSIPVTLLIFTVTLSLAGLFLLR